MADRYFVNGGGALNWGLTANWSTSSGGAGGASVPGTSDTAIFDINSPNCTLAANQNCLNFNATAAYAGTFALAGYTLQCYDEWTSAGGSFTHGNGKITFFYTNARSIINSAGWIFYDLEFNMSGFSVDLGGYDLTATGLTLITAIGGISNGNINVKGNLRTTDTSVAGTAVFILNGTSNQTVDANGGSGAINNLVVNNPGNTIYFKDNIAIYMTTFLHTAGTQDWTTYSATLTFAGNVGKTWTPATNDYYNVTWNSNYSHTLAGNAIIKGKLTIQSIGQISGVSYSMKCHGDVQCIDTTYSGTLGASASIEFSGSGAQKLYVDEAGGSGQIARVQITKTGGTLTVKDTINVSVRWNWNSGVVDFGTSTIHLTLGSDLTIDPGPYAFNNVTIDQGIWDISTVTGTWIIAGTLNIISIDVMNGNYELRGNLVCTDTAISGTGAFTFTGTADQTITAGSTIDFPDGNWVINKSSGTVTLLSNLVLNATGQDLTVTSGTLDLNGYNLTVNDQFTVNAGLTLKGNETITAGTKTISSTTSTVTFKDAAVTAVLGTHTKTYFNLVLGASKTHEIATGAGNQITVNGTFSSNGTSSTRSVLRSVADASSQWYLNLVGSSTLADKVNVKYSNANAGNLVTASGSVNSGNNNNWDFGAVALTANNLAVAVAIQTPTLGQVHALTANNLAVAVSLQTPTLAEVHALDADDLAISVSLQTPTLGQVHALTSDSLSVAVTLSTPTLAQVHALTANNLAVAIAIESPSADAGFEDFTTYTEVDPNSDITKTEKFIDFYTLLRSTIAYVYKDKGVGHFKSDFHHAVRFNISEFSGDSAVTTVWALSNDIGDRQDLVNANKPLLYVAVQRAPGNVRQIVLGEFDGTTLYTDPYTGVTVGADYYLEIERDELVGTYGTLYCRIYSDSNRSVLVDTLTLTLHSALDYRYVYGLQSKHAALSVTISGQVGPLSLANEYFHVLDSNDLAIGVSLQTPTLSQNVDNLMANSLAVAVSLQTPAIGQVHALDADDLAVAVSIQTPTLAQVHALMADSLSVAVSIQTPTLAESVDNLTADNLAMAVSVSTPSLGQVHVLDSDDLAIAVSMQTPTAAEGIHHLTSDNIAIAVSISTPTLGQVHVLDANDLSITVSLSTPTLGQIHALDSDDLSIAVSLSTPTLAEGIVNLVADDLAVAVSIQTPTLGQIHTLDANDLSIIISLSTPTLGQVHVLDANDLSINTSISTPTLSETHSLSSDNLSVTISLQTPTLGQVHVLDSNDLGINITVAEPTIGQIHILTSGELNASLTLGTPTLTSHSVDNLTCDDLSIDTSIYVQLTGPWLFNYTEGGSPPTIGQTVVGTQRTRTGVR